MARFAGSACGGAVRFAALRIATFIAAHCCRRGPLRMSVALISAFLLLGCAAEYGQQNSNPRRADLVISLPERALLQPQGEPGCELKASQEEGGEGAEQRHPPAPPSETSRKLG